MYWCKKGQYQKIIKIIVVLFKETFWKAASVKLKNQSNDEKCRTFVLCLAKSKNSSVLKSFFDADEGIKAHGPRPKFIVERNVQYSFCHGHN